MLTNASKITEQLYSRMFEHNFEGIDPSSFKFHPSKRKIDKFIRNRKSKIFRKLLYYLFHGCFFLFPKFFLFFFKPATQKFSKSLALIISGIAMKREELTPDDFNKINILTKALLEKKLQHLNLWAHDVEYDFGNDIEVTTDTPNLVTSAFVINAFWDAYKKTDKIYFLNLFKASVEDLIKTIKYKEFNDNTICFFYTTITKDCIHNANLLYSELLAKYISLNTENNNFLIELLKKSIRFSLNHFDNTASIPYGIEILSVDNYHTGYVIRSLSVIEKYCGDLLLEFNLINRIINYVHFYYDNFIKKYVVRDNILPIYLLESHSLAESILIFSCFKKHLSKIENENFLLSINNSFILLYNEQDKYFYNNIKKFGFIEIFDTTDYIRWSNSWMFYALKSYIASNE